MNDPRILPPRNGSSGQRGGFAVGLVVGLLIGLAVALGVALYITKAPIPFMNKVQQRTSVQDAAEAEKNKNWDPNSPLYGKNPVKPGASASGTVSSPVPSLPTAGTSNPTGPAVAPTLPPPVATDAPPRVAPTLPGRDPAAILADKPAAPRITSTVPGASTDPFTYFVQAGAYGRPEDAEQQRARLAMMGMEGRMSEREQSGRTVYRVRVGPFDTKADADAAKDKLSGAGVEAALVRVQR